jgi:hypothetical protein
MDYRIRTENPYATFGPAELPDVSWRQYFDRIRQHEAPDGSSGDEDAEVDTDTRVEIPSRLWAAGDRMPGGLKTWINRLEANGFETVIGYREEYVPESTVKTGDNKGNTVAAKHIYYTWVSARKMGKGVINIRFRQLGDSNAMCEYRIHKGEVRLYSDGEMKAYATG